MTEKTTTTDPVALRQSLPQPEHVGRSDILHTVSQHVCFLEAEIADRETLKYSLKIFAPSFGGMLCLRLDSRGGDHINKETGDGLPSRIVPTPHFHKVDKDGWMRAYHTDELRDPRIAEAIASNVALGTNLFCQEVNLVSPSGSTVVLQHIPTELPLSSTGAMDSVSFP